MSIPSPSDFFTLARYCFDLGVRIQGLGDEHKHLRAGAGVLSLAFHQLHQTLLNFKDIPGEYNDIFADLRTSCYLTLQQIEPTLDEFDGLRRGNAVSRGAKKLMMAVKNSTAELKRELRDQFVMLSMMVIRLNQMHDSFIHHKRHATIVEMLKDLKSELARSQTPTSRRMAFQPEALEQASADFLRLAPPGSEIGAEMRATFDEFIGHHAWVDRHAAPAAPPRTYNEPTAPHYPAAYPALPASEARVVELDDYPRFSDAEDPVAVAKRLSLSEYQERLRRERREQRQREEKEKKKKQEMEARKQREREEKKKKEQEAKAKAIEEDRGMTVEEKRRRERAERMRKMEKEGIVVAIRATVSSTFRRAEMLRYAVAIGAFFLSMMAFSVIFWFGGRLLVGCYVALKTQSA